MHLIAIPSHLVEYTRHFVWVCVCACAFVCGRKHTNTLKYVVIDIGQLFQGCLCFFVYTEERHRQNERFSLKDGLKYHALVC